MSELIKHNSGEDLLEKVIINNDLAGLSSIEKVTHIKNVCESLGLNPLTKPFQLLKFQGKEVMYTTKDATEQLRKNNHVSITSIETKMIDGIYIVIANAALPNGRTDSSTGVISVKGLIGDAMANAMMKAETKSKRRVTLSICGLGCLDETEIDTMKGAIKLDHNPQTGEVIEPPKQLTKLDQDFNSFMDYMSLMKAAKDMGLLKETFIKAANKFKNNPRFMEKLTIAKDESKDRIETEQDLARTSFESMPSGTSGQGFNTETGKWEDIKEENVNNPVENTQ